MVLVSCKLGEFVVGRMYYRRIPVMLRLWVVMRSGILGEVGVEVGVEGEGDV